MVRSNGQVINYRQVARCDRGTMLCGRISLLGFIILTAVLILRQRV